MPTSNWAHVLPRSPYPRFSRHQVPINPPKLPQHQSNTTFKQHKLSQPSKTGQRQKTLPKTPTKITAFHIQIPQKHFLRSHLLTVGLTRNFYWKSLVHEPTFWPLGSTSKHPELLLHYSFTPFFFSLRTTCASLIYIYNCPFTEIRFYNVNKNTSHDST